MKFTKTLLAVATVAATLATASAAPMNFADSKSMSYSVYAAYNYRFIKVNHVDEKVKINEEEVTFDTSKKYRYSGTLAQIGFGAHYNLVNSDMFKVALGGDLFTTSGNYQSNFKNDINKKEQESPMSIDAGVSAILTAKLDHARPFLKVGAAYEYTRGFQAKGLVVGANLGVELNNGLTAFLGYQYVNESAQKWFTKEVINKKVTSQGLVGGLGFTF